MPQTLILAVSPTGEPESALAQAAALLREGKLVAFPTETVYGLGADATNPHAVAAIFAAKERPASDPLIVHIADLEQLSSVVAETPPLALERSSATAARSAPSSCRSRRRRCSSSRTGSGGQTRTATRIATAAPIAVSQRRAKPEWNVLAAPNAIRKSADTAGSTFGVAPTRRRTPTSVPAATAQATVPTSPISRRSSAAPRATPTKTPRTRSTEMLTEANGSPLIATNGISAAKIGRGSPASVPSHHASTEAPVIFTASFSSATRSRCSKRALSLTPCVREETCSVFRVLL